MRLMLLMGTETYRATDFLAAARNLQIDLVVGLDCPSPVEALNPGSSLVLDFNDREQAAENIVALHEKTPIDALMAVDDAAIPLAARAGQKLKLPGNPEEAVIAAGNKFVFREIMQAAGLVSPWFNMVPLSANPAEVAQNVPYPCVLKPLFLNASRGVIRADSHDEFIEAFLRIATLLREEEIAQQGGTLAEYLLVESFMPGEEVALEGLVNDGEFRLLAFFDKPDPLNGPFFEETIFVTPSRHPRLWQDRALEVVQAGVRALGLRTGPVHAEVRLHTGEPYLLELAPRSIGGHCSRTLRFGTGLTLEELILRQALGLAIVDGVREHLAAGVMMIPIPAKGWLRGVHGLEEARAVRDIVDIEISIPVNRRVVPVPEGHRYLGFIFSKSDTPGEAEAALRRAHECLSFEISG